MALETLNNRYGIRHFDEGGSTNAPVGTVSVTGAPANVASDPIAGLYQSTFNRAPDATGLSFWQNALNSGTSLADITTAFQNSPEAQVKATAPATVVGGGSTTTAPTFGSTNAIQNWYETNLGRPADQEGLNYWGNAFGTTLDPNEITQLQASPEYTNRQAVSNYYDTELGRKASEDTAGLDYWSGLANSGTSLADIRKGISGSSEGQTFDLNKLYQNELGRTADEEGLKSWQDAMASGMSMADVQKAFNASPEGTMYDIYKEELGRAPDAEGAASWAQQNLTPEQLRAAISGSEEGRKYDVTGMYKDYLDRAPDETGLKSWMDALNSGIPLEEIKKSFTNAPEVIVSQDYQKYLGRTPEADAAKYWQDQLAAGKTKEQIAHEIALSGESISANSSSVKAILEATLGKDIASTLTPEQIAEYTKTILDPTRQGANKPVSKDQFDANFYLQNNKDVAASGLDPYQHYTQYGINEGRLPNANSPTYLTEAENIQEVYKQIALDPVLGAKLKAANPMLWEKLTPLANRPEDLKRTERTVYGQYGTVKVEGIDVPILNGQRVDQLFGDANSGTISNFSHDRGRLSADLGWSSNSFSSKLSKGADALGVTKTENEYGTDYTGLNEAADLLGIDKSQFKDYQVPVLTEPTYDEWGNMIQEGGQPAFNTDPERWWVEPTPVMKTITAQDQLYDAVGKASKDIYSYTGDSLTPGQGSEGGAKSFDTVMYKRNGDELIPISKPVSHGGMQNFDTYQPKDDFTAPLMMAVAVAAMVVAPELAPILMAEFGAVAGTIMTGVVIGAGAGAANATISGKSIGDASLKGGVVGGVTAGVTAGLAEGLSSAFPPTVLADGTQVANSVFTGASEMMNGAISPAGVQSVVTQTLARTLTTGITPGASGDKILNAFGTALVSSGLSVAASEQIISQMQDSGLDRDSIAKLARTVQLAVNTGTTGAMSGKSNDQILQSIISGVVSGAPSIASAKGTPPAIEPTNPFGTENVGITSNSVDKVLQSQIMDGIANKTDDPIAFLQAAKNWTGDGSKNVEYVTTTMAKQGIPADQISADLQDLYRISASKADEYAQYIVAKTGNTSKPTTTATTTTAQQPVATVAQTSAPITAPTPDAYANRVFNSMVDAFSNPSVAGPAYAPLAQALPVSRYDVGSSSPLVTSGATQSNLGGTSPANDPTSYKAYSPRPGLDEYSNTYPSVFGKAAQDPNYIRELVEAYKADPTYAPYREELQKLDPKNPILISNEVSRVETPEQAYQAPVKVPSYKPELSALPKPVEPPMPMPEPRPEPEPMPATPSPNEPANDPFILPEPVVPGRKITPIVPVSPPGALPSLPPNFVPLQDPNKAPAPDIKPLAPPSDQPVTPATPATPNAPVQEPTGEPEKEKQPSPEQKQIIQKVAKTPEEGKKLEIAVPKVTKLITQGVPRTVAIPTVAREVGVPVEDLTTVIDVTVPEVPTVTPPTVTPPAPKTTAPKAPKQPTTTAGGYGIISPFLMQQYGGIQDLAPGLTEGGNYSLSGIPNTNLNMNPMNPVSPLQQFAATSPASPLELGDDNQNQETLHLATGGSATQQQAYNPYDVSTGISGSLTPGLTKARLDYLLTGLPQGHAQGGTIEGHNPQFFSEGGLGSMDNTFVKGEGDGTSDSVPAMLANGEFVIPADIVSGLGNGSNDAGAQVLQEFLKVIREHKHSAKANSLPPKSKGPLAYLTNAKRKVKVA